MEFFSHSRITSVKSEFSGSRLAAGLDGTLHEIELKGKIQPPRSRCRIANPDNSGIVGIYISLKFFPGPYMIGPLDFDEQPPNIGTLVISPADPEAAWLPSNMPTARMNIRLPINQFLPISSMRNSLIKLTIQLSADDKFSSIKYHEDGHETWYIDEITFEEEIPSI